MFMIRLSATLDYNCLSIDKISRDDVFFRLLFCLMRILSTPPNPLLRPATPRPPPRHTHNRVACTSPLLFFCRLVDTPGLPPAPPFSPLAARRVGLVGACGVMFCFPDGGRQQRHPERKMLADCSASRHVLGVFVDVLCCFQKGCEFYQWLLILLGKSVHTNTDKGFSIMLGKSVHTNTNAGFVLSKVLPSSVLFNI